MLPATPARRGERRWGRAREGARVRQGPEGGGGGRQQGGGRGWGRPRPPRLENAAEITGVAEIDETPDAGRVVHGSGEGGRDEGGRPGPGGKSPRPQGAPPPSVRQVGSGQGGRGGRGAVDAGSRVDGGGRRGGGAGVGVDKPHGGGHGGGGGWDRHGEGGEASRRGRGRRGGSGAAAGRPPPRGRGRRRRRRRRGRRRLSTEERCRPPRRCQGARPHHGSAQGVGANEGLAPAAPYGARGPGRVERCDTSFGTRPGVQGVRTRLGGLNVAARQTHVLSKRTERRGWGWGKGGGGEAGGRRPPATATAAVARAPRASRRADAASLACGGRFGSPGQRAYQRAILSAARSSAGAGKGGADASGGGGGCRGAAGAGRPPTTPVARRAGAVAPRSRGGGKCHRLSPSRD